MANTILTPTAVTREVLRVAHEKLSFIGTIDRQYDDSFAKTGAKIGTALKIRQPNKYTVRTGKTLNVQDTEETSTTLTVATQKGVDMNFSSVDLTMSLDDFSKRIVEPAVAVLMSNIEADALQTMTKDVYNHAGTRDATDISLIDVANAKAKLNQGLAPKDMSNRFMQMDSISMTYIVDELKGLFHDQAQISKQYREGLVGKAVGLNWYENERVLSLTTSADVAGAINQDATAPAEGDTTFTIDAMTAAPVVGSVFTIAGVYAVHPETKDSYGHLQQFVVTSDTTPTTTAMSFSPSLQASGANQNINELPSTNDVITFVGAASKTAPEALVYHKEAFCFASADLMMPSGVDFAAREVMDGLSCRLVRQYDINNDNIPCRLDILYGYKTLRPEWACRIAGIEV